MQEEASGARKRKRGWQEGCAGATADVAEEVDDESQARGDAVGYENAGPRLPLTEEDDDDEACYDGIAEEAVAELMRWLEAEFSGDAPDDDPAGFVTINGDEETCGPSSSAASTVMASVDTCAGAPPPPPVRWPWPLAVPDVEAKREVATDTEMAGPAWLTCGPALQGV